MPVFFSNAGKISLIPSSTGCSLIKIVISSPECFFQSIAKIFPIGRVTTNREDIINEINLFIIPPYNLLFIQII